MPYYYKSGDRESGPFEERIIIARMIDGEINSRSLIRSSSGNEYRTLGSTEFGAVLDKLTRRWKYNMAALNREIGYLYGALALLFAIPALTLFGAYREWGFFVRNAHATFFGMQTIWFFVLAATLYFYWMVGYRLWRIVPKSMYSVTPGWRILLTLVPFFRLGWNYCMWVRLADRLRRLTNYTRRAGRAMAICYSTGVIFSTLGFWGMLFLPYLPFMTVADKFPAATIAFGTCFWISEAVMLIITAFFFVRMIASMRKTAIAILRRRYAYNVPTEEVKSTFMNNVLAAQRHRDRRRRWGHGLGIVGVLVGSPIVLGGLPLLVLLIAGSCRYQNGLDNLSQSGYAASERDFYNLYYPARPPAGLTSVNSDPENVEYPALRSFIKLLEQDRNWAQSRMSDIPEISGSEAKKVYLEAQTRDQRLTAAYCKMVQAELLKMDIFRKNLSFDDVVGIWNVGQDDLRCAYLGYIYFHSPLADLAMRRYIDRAREMLRNAELDFHQYPGADTPGRNRLWQQADFISLLNRQRTVNLEIARTRNALRRLQKAVWLKFGAEAEKTLPPFPMLNAETGQAL